MKNTFWKNIFKLSSASAACQIIIFATTPILTRLFGPEAFGVAATITAIILFIGPIASLSYQNALIVSENGVDAINITALSLVLAILTSVAVTIGIFLGCRFNMLPSLKHLYCFAWLIPVGILSRSLLNILTFEATRQNSFNGQSLSRLAQTVFERGSSLGLALKGLNSSAVLVYTRVLSFVIETAVLLPVVKQLVSKFHDINIAGIKKVAIKYREFPYFANFTYMIGNGSAYFPLFYLGYYFGSSATGLYAISDRLLQTPMHLFGDSIRRVYYKQAAFDHASGVGVGNFFDDIRTKLLTVGMLPFFLVAALSPVLSKAFLGESWANASTFISSLCFLTVSQLLTSPVSSVVNVLGLQKKFLAINIFALSLRIYSIIIGGTLHNLTIALWLMAITGIAANLLINIWINKHLHISNLKFLMKLVISLAVQALLSIPVFYSVNVFSTPITIFISSVIATFYYIFIYTFPISNVGVVNVEDC